MNEEELKHRIKNAISILETGHSFKVGDLTLNSKSKKHLTVTGFTIINELENVTKQTAIKELNETKELFQKMVAVSSELESFIIEKKIKYCLGYDYGNGGIGICCEVNGEVEWNVEVEK